MKIGDTIKIVSVPSGLQGETKALFEHCVGRIFPIFAIVPVAETGSDLLEIHVGEVLSKPAYMHSIWIEKEHVTPAVSPNEP